MSPNLFIIVCDLSMMTKLSLEGIWKSMDSLTEVNVVISISVQPNLHILEYF